MSSPDPTYYEVLGVRRDASYDDVRSAYWSKVAKLGPPLRQLDATGANALAAAIDALNDAWETLCDPQRRERYDTALRRGNAELKFRDHITVQCGNAAYAFRDHITKRESHRQIAAIFVSVILLGILLLGMLNAGAARLRGANLRNEATSASHAKPLSGSKTVAAEPQRH